MNFGQKKNQSISNRVKWANLYVIKIAYYTAHKTENVVSNRRKSTGFESIGRRKNINIYSNVKILLWTDF